MDISIDSILKDHKKFLIITAENAGLLISDSNWSRTKTYLSPIYKYKITQSICMAQLFEQTELEIFKTIKTKSVTKLYIKYVFPEFEVAACKYFIVSSKSINNRLILDYPSISHYISIIDDLTFFGVVTICN